MFGATLIVCAGCKLGDEKRGVGLPVPLGSLPGKMARENKRGGESLYRRVRTADTISELTAFYQHELEGSWQKRRISARVTFFNDGNFVPDAALRDPVSRNRLRPAGLIVLEEKSYFTEIRLFRWWPAERVPPAYSSF